ncbi:MAG: cytochrome c biogenesis protein CcdA [Flavobacteriales bacterium]
MRNLFFLLWAFLSTYAMAQVLNPVQWTSSWKKLPDDTYELSMKAQLEVGWHLYSMRLRAGEIGIPTSVRFKDEGKVYKKIDALEEVGQLKEKSLPELGGRFQYLDDKIIYKQKVKTLSSGIFIIETDVEFQACDENRCLPPDTQSFSFLIDPKLSSDDLSNRQGVDFVEQSMRNPIICKNDFKCISWSKLYQIFFLGLLGGFAAVLMPCIFPMIPLTVGFFTKCSNKGRSSSVRKALIYGLSIVVIYLVLGLCITLLFGVSTLNELSTNPWLNLLFFLLFILFALSFFGVFDINLPESWANIANQKVVRGSLLGIFFMALVLVLVSFSCTGPIVGTLLVEAATGGALWGSMAGMLGFSSGLALPFVLFAIFPSWLHALPRSGGWLNTVKVSFGFIELVLAMKFLSNADLVWQLHVIEREIFIAFWLVLFALLGLYLLRIFSLSKDKPGQGIGVIRLLLAILSLSLSVYILPGLFGAPLKLLSGFIPPQIYSENFQGFFISPDGILDPHVEGIERGPHELMIFRNYEHGLAHARVQRKPILLDFTGYACANCRKMEDIVWSDEQVRHFLNNDLVVISLYVDDRQMLPEKAQYLSNILGKEVKTLGQKWTEFQIKHFKANAQPYYVIVDHKFKPLNTPIGAEFNINRYLDWLKFGVENFLKR